MSSYSLPSRYQSYLGANFFQRQLSSVADALPGVLRRGLAQTPKGPAPTNPGLPDVTDLDKPKSNTMLYVGLGASVLVLFALVAKRKGAAKAA